MSDPDARSNVALFLGKLQFLHNVPASVSAFVADSVRNIVSDAITEAIDNVSTDSQDAATHSKTLQALGEFRSRHNLDKFIRDGLAVVQPETIELGRSAQGKPYRYQYISIIEQLQNILAFNDNIAKFVLHELRPNHLVLRDVIDGSCHRDDASGVIRLIFYFDEFGIVDPLGNKSSKYKVGAIYYSILNIPSRLRSRLCGIFLAALFKSSLIKRVGWHKLLQRFLTDIAQLRTGGILVRDGEGRQICLKGVASCFVGDNLGLKGIGGFTENFSTGRCCRTCTSPVDTQQCLFEESNTLLRTPVSFQEQITELTSKGFPQTLVSEYGIKGRSPLCDIEEAFPVLRLPPDVAHDLLEGVVPYTLCLVLDSLITNGVFSLEILNHRIGAFNFQESNRPQPLKRTKGALKVKETAREAWTLLRTLSLVIGDLVPAEDTRWRVHIGLCELVEIILAPDFSEGDIVYLEQRVAEWLELIRDTFPDFRIKPKFHFLIHYGTHIRRHGPLRHLWTLRFESKHSSLKTIADRSKNRIDVCKTVASKHQRALALHLHDQGYMSDGRIEGLQSNTSDRRSAGGCLLASAAVNGDIGHSVAFNGTSYKRGDVVLVHEEDVSFGVIKAVAVKEGDVFLALTMLSCEYDMHLNAYKVGQTDSMKVVPVLELADYHPLKVYQVNDESYVVLMWHVRGD